MSAFDVIIIGGGVNGMGAAALLAKCGKKTLLLEANEKCGGAIRTEEVTLPGYRHDLFATNLSLFAGGPIMAELKDDLVAAGLEFVPSKKPFCSVFPDGKALGVVQDFAATEANINRIAPEDLEAWRALSAKLGLLAPHILPILGNELPSFKVAKALFKSWRALGTTEFLSLIRLLLQSTRSFTSENFRARETRALAASWGMHLDYGPDIAGGALFAFLESIGGQMFGMVLGKGGADVIPNALSKVITKYGGEIRTGTKVKSITSENGMATGITLVNGEVITSQEVIANINPALIPNLLDSNERSRPEIQEIKKFTPGLATMMIHLALDKLPQWIAEEAREYNYVHIGPYVDDMALAYAEAAAGKLPKTPTLVVGQPTLTDPSRAPEGKHILWVQVRVLPHGIDWANEGERYADQVIEIIESYAPGTKSSILSRAVLTPSDLERYNANLIGGDSLGGSHHISQFFFLRPLPAWSRHRTPLKNLWICGSGTWPGGGVGGASGAIVANSLA
jgi:phytoene dehydrogenase-like protein